MVLTHHVLFGTKNNPEALGVWGMSIVGFMVFYLCALSYTFCILSKMLHNVIMILGSQQLRQQFGSKHLLASHLDLQTSATTI